MISTSQTPVPKQRTTNPRAKHPPLQPKFFFFKPSLFCTFSLLVSCSWLTWLLPYSLLYKYPCSQHKSKPPLRAIDRPQTYASNRNDATISNLYFYRTKLEWWIKEVWHVTCIKGKKNIYNNFGLLADNECSTWHWQVCGQAQWQFFLSTYTEDVIMQEAVQNLELFFSRNVDYSCEKNVHITRVHLSQIWDYFSTNSPFLSPLFYTFTWDAERR